MFNCSSPSEILPLRSIFAVACISFGIGSWAAEGSDDSAYFLQMSLQDLLALETTIASGESSSILNSISTVSVITREDIERYNYDTIEDALRTLAGIDIYRTYFKNSIPTSRGILQDHYANKVLLMVNNVPTWHATTGELNLHRINIHDVEKIEVLKGPSSVLYGTNAYSGAINVKLKEPGKAKSQLYTAVGLDDHYEAGGSWQYASDDSDLAMMLSAHQRHDGRLEVDFVDENDVSGEFDDYIDTQTLTFNGRYKNHQLLLNVYNNSEAYMGIIPSYPNGVGYGHDLKGYLLGYQFEMAPDSDSKLKVSARYDWNERSFLRSVDAGTWGEVAGYHVAGRVSYFQVLNQHYSLSTGIDVDYRVSEVYRNYQGDSDATITHNNLKDQDLLEYSFFASLGYEQDDWTWNIGLRSVENELFANAVSGRATLVYSLSENSSVKFIVGQSYRSPSLFELYFIPPEQTIFGNEDLSPEKSNSYEVAYLRSFGDFFVQMTAYYGEYSNKIYRDQDDVVLDDGTVIVDTLVYKNGNEFTATGIEVESRYEADRWSAFTNLTWQEGSDGDRLSGSDHYNFKYAPSHSVSAGIARDICRLQLSVVANYRSATEGTTDNDIDSSLTLDLAATYKQSLGDNRTIEHRLKINNATDERVEVADYARRRGLDAVMKQSGRIVIYGLALQF